METDEVAIKYKGFTPPGEAEEFFRSLLVRLQEESPNSSYIRAKIAKSGDHFRGIIRLNSIPLRVLTFAETKDLRDLGRELYEKLRKQLNQWKEKRFQEGEGLGYQL